MKIAYLCDFDFSRSSGKDRATRQKLEALSNNVENIKVFNLRKSNHYYKLLMGIILDLECSYYILRESPDILISRGNTGFLSHLSAKNRGALTVREIHASTKGELDLLPYHGVKKLVLKNIFSLFHKLDLLSDIRIFNHPFLLDFYKKNEWSKPEDFYCYNGFDGSQGKKEYSRQDVLKKYNLDEKSKYLVFIGSVSAWHGAEYLVSLQNEFIKNNDNFKIIVAGGDLSKYDPNGICINITPLDDIACDELISIGEACLLPVKNNRISPGSPLKLYDYIKNRKPVIAQDITGYSDEVTAYNVGIGVNFEKPLETREAIINYLNQLDVKISDFESLEVSWDSRMKIWIENIEKVVNKHSR